MNQSEFMKMLKKQIKKIPTKEQKDILNEYEVHFINAKQNGLSENEICKELGNPKSIGKEIYATYTIDIAQHNKNLSSFLKALLSISSLSIINLLIVCVAILLTILLLPFILTIVIITLVLLLLPVILIISGFYYGFHIIQIVDVFKSFLGVLIGIILAGLIVYTLKNSKNLFIQYLKWNIKIIKRGVEK